MEDLKLYESVTLYKKVPQYIEERCRVGVQLPNGETYSMATIEKETFYVIGRNVSGFNGIYGFLLALINRKKK